jgi:hypothetical protein
VGFCAEDTVNGPAGENGLQGGENREEKKNGTGPALRKRPKKAAGNRILIIFSDPFINYKLIGVQVKFEIQMIIIVI